MYASLTHRAVLVDYDDDLFSPTGNEAVILAEAGISWATARHTSSDEMVAFARDADVVLIQSARRLLTREAIGQLLRCRGIVRVGIGYDSVDGPAAAELGIPLCNVPEYCVHEVAEHALALLLACARVLSPQDRMLRAGGWDRTVARPTIRVTGKTLGLIGFGRTARALAEKAGGLGLKMLAYDPYVSQETAALYGVRLVSLDDLLRQAVLISVHAPLTGDTHHLLGEREFALFSPGSIVVNTSRGPVIDEAALVRALKSGQVASAGLDVMEREPIPADSELLGLDNVLLTPHVAGFSAPSVEALYHSACRIAIDLVRGPLPKEVVNGVERLRSL